jgi:hypothetical protein
MKQLVVAVIVFIFSAVSLQAQSDWNHISMHDVVSMDSFTQKGFTLVFINKDSLFNKETGKRMVDAFFTVYPKEAALYNPNTLKRVIFIVDPGYNGVAATSGSIVRYNPGWMHKNPNDIDVVTHEVMHIVQSYPHNAGPGWITEGIADYVRATLGVDNKGAGWSMPAFNANQHYENAYRVTARFFVWIEKNKKKGFVQALDSAMRTHTYTPAFWQTNAGQSVDELWKEYAVNPSI